MSNEPIELSVMEKVVIQGDLSALNPSERYLYYTKVCESMGLNPLTKPFDYLRLEGKLVLYATRNCTEQLRKLQKITVIITGRERISDVYCVTARGTTPDGRTDESMGVVPLVKEEKVWDEMRGKKISTGNIIPLTPDEFGNALMKAETKAKRRVTLSLAGLGMMDESEIETVEGAERVEVHDEQLPGKKEEKKSTKTQKSTTKNATTKAAQPPNTSVYEFIDMVGGETPKKTPYFQMKAKNIDSGKEIIVFANTPETMKLLEGIHEKSRFEMDFASENEINVLRTIRILNDTPVTPEDRETYELIECKFGKSPGGMPFAQLKVNGKSGQQEVILARTPEMINAVEKLQKNARFIAKFSVENGFKVLQSIQMIGDEAA